MRTFELEVCSVTSETPLIRAFELAAPDGAELPAFTTGAHPGCPASPNRAATR